MNRTERLYAIMAELRRVAPRGRTSGWLAAHLGVSARTIKRDMAALMASDVGLVADEGRGGGYSLDRARVLPPLTFTADEATAVALAIAADPALPLQDSARAALSKLLAAMTHDQRRAADDLGQRLWVGGGPPRGRWARVLDEAIRERRVVHLDYINGDGERTDRRAVEPMALVRTRLHWSLLGWCRLREAGRWFRTDRVLAAHLTSEVAPHRDLAATFGEPPEGAHPIHVG